MRQHQPSWRRKSCGLIKRDWRPETVGSSFPLSTKKPAIVQRVACQQASPSRSTVWHESPPKMGVGNRLASQIRRMPKRLVVVFVPVSCSSWDRERAPSNIGGARWRQEDGPRITTGFGSHVVHSTRPFPSRSGPRRFATRDLIESSFRFLTTILG